MPHGRSPTHKRRSKRSGRSSRATPTAAPEPDGGASREDRAEQDAPAEHGAGEGGIRLQKLLAAAGFGSRRDVERFLVEERVTVNGRVARLGDRADPRRDDVRLDGERIAAERPAYWILNKPRGVVTTRRDEAGRRTVMDLLPRGVENVFPVGRLDRETGGLLLLTNDGDTAHALLHPSLGNEREYRVEVRGRIDPRTIARLEKGVPLEDGRSAPTRVDGVRFDPDAKTSSFSLTVVEGRKRQIRRTLLVLGFPVRRLTRVRMGPLRLGRLPAGEARRLRADERRRLLDHVAHLRDESDRDGARPRLRKARTGRASQRSVRSRKGARR
jgi:23S rRNA pseudouridine2605 synthase